MASLSLFLQVWREELPWVEIRASSGPFTHCGLCDYLKMLIASATDARVRQALLLRLGAHYDFQAAQRIAMSSIFRQSERDAANLLAISWDKMDQLKTIIPRVRQLANTNFFKTGSRLVVGLIGVLAPGVFQRPLFYAIFEDQRHGADMIVVVMIDVLWEAARIMGRLPKRLFIQADNIQGDQEHDRYFCCSMADDTVAPNAPGAN